MYMSTSALYSGMYPQTFELSGMQFLGEQSTSRRVGTETSPLLLGGVN